jgi:hypothetical protein
MQEINLLQNKLKDTTSHWEKNNRAIVVILGLVLVAELVVGGMFYLLTKNAVDAKESTDADNARLLTELNSMADELAKAKGFQAQAKNIDTLLRNHVIWSNIINSTSASTYKASRFFSMNSDTSGKMHIEGIVPSYTDLGKLILAFETNNDLKKVDLLSTTKSTTEQTGILFAIQLMADQGVFLNKN